MPMRPSVILAVAAVSLPATPAGAYDPPCPRLELVVASRPAVFVARVTEAHELFRGDGTEAKAALEVECCLAGKSCSQRRIEVTYRARGGVDERDMAVSLAPGQRYIVALASSPPGSRFRLKTYAAEDLVFELEAPPEYREDRTSRIRAALPWGTCATEVVSFDEVVAMALKNPEHALPPMCKP